MRLFHRLRPDPGVPVDYSGLAVCYFADGRGRHYAGMMVREDTIASHHESVLRTGPARGLAPGTYLVWIFLALTNARHREFMGAVSLRPMRRAVAKTVNLLGDVIDDAKVFHIAYLDDPWKPKAVREAALTRKQMQELGHL